MTRPTSRLLAGLAIALAIGGLGWAAWMARAQTDPPPARARAEVGVPVVVVAASAADDALAVDAVGSGRALRSATLRAAVAGEVASVHFRAGQRVQAGQVLLRLVDRRQQLELQAADARLDRARRLLARYAGTEGSGAVPGSVIDEARSALREAEVARAMAEEAIAERLLRAPFAGVIGLARVDPGDRLTSDSEVAVLDDRRRLVVEFDVPEAYLARLQPGHPVDATTVAYPERRFAGRVTQIDSRVAAGTRALRVRAELPNDDDLLRPGQSFTVRLKLTGESRLQVPDLALQWGRDGGHVWVLREGKAERVPVQLVRRLDGRVLVDGELRVGEPVVVEGVQRLRPGREVRVVEPAP